MTRPLAAEIVEELKALQVRPKDDWQRGYSFGLDAAIKAVRRVERRRGRGKKAKR